MSLADIQYSALVKYNDGTILKMHHAAFEKGPLCAQIGNSSTTIELEKIASIEVVSTNAPVFRVKLIPRSGGAPLYTTLPMMDALRGNIISSGVTYRLTTQLHQCVQIDFVKETDSPPVYPEWLQEKGFTITSTAGQTRKLSHTTLWTVYEANTGYSSSLGMVPIKKDAFTQTGLIALATPLGLCEFNVGDIKDIDFTSRIVTLRNGHTVALQSKGKTTGVDFKKLLRAVSGADVEGYWAIDATYILRISDGFTSQEKMPEYKAADFAEPLRNVTITDAKGTTYSLTNVTIKSPVAALGMGQILTGCRPCWTVHRYDSYAGGESLEPCEQHKNQLCFVKNNFWRCIPILSIKSITFSKDSIAVGLQNSTNVIFDDIEIDTINGKGTWGDVKVSRSGITSLEIIEH